MGTDTTSTLRRSDGQARTLAIALSRSRVARLLAGAVVVLHLLNVPAVVFRYVLEVPGSTAYATIFGVASEGKLPTFYSGLTLLAAALLLWATATSERDSQGRFVRHWQGLAIIFVGMAADELLELHDLATGPTRRLLGISSGPFYFAWVIPMTLVLGLLAVAYARFLMTLPRTTLRAFVIAGSIYVGGALGMEIVGSAYLTAYGNDLAYGVISTIEELGEMIGMALFICALMDHLRRDAPDWRIHLRA